MKIILGVTGSISAYKAVDILRIFQKNKHIVSVVMTKSATEFITPLPFKTFSPDRVFLGMFDNNQDPLLHINLARENDLLLVAPATANIIGKFANGIADDLLSSLFLAFHNKVILAPSMNSHMLENPAYINNQNILIQRGIKLIEPDQGSLACTEDGKGRLPSAEVIYNFCLEECNV
jgi:phosphopantothenoylcysteine decarboxylase/phosphopantothenate--cysteine ligase